MAGLSKQGVGVAPLYNATPYEGVGGRGWCVVEQGSSTVVAAHLAKAKEIEKGLIERFERAEAARAKVINITGDTPEERRFTDVDPIELLDRTMRELSVARFTFSSDRAVAEEMMAGFEWIIKSAMEQAELAQHADLLTVTRRWSGGCSLGRRTGRRLVPPHPSARGSRMRAAAATARTWMWPRWTRDRSLRLARCLFVRGAHVGRGAWSWAWGCTHVQRLILYTVGHSGEHTQTTMLRVGSPAVIPGNKSKVWNARRASEVQKATGKRLYQHRD